MTDSRDDINHPLHDVVCGRCGQEHGGQCPLERWPGYNEQSWQQRFAELDRRHADVVAKMPAIAKQLAKLWHPAPASPVEAAADDLLAALVGAMGILGTAESNASGNPEWDYVAPRIEAARAAITKATGQQVTA